LPAPIAKSIENAGTLIKAVAAIIALFPGVAVLAGLVDVPPSLIQLVKIISFSVSGIVLLSVFLLGDRLRRMSGERAAIGATIAVLLGAACATGYFTFANRYTVSVEDIRGEVRTYIVPMQPSPAIRRIVEPMQNDYRLALHISADRAELKRLMTAESGTSMTIMILLLVFSQVLLVAPVVGIAWKLAGAPAPGSVRARTRRSRAKDPPHRQH
jgi:hypothetical protein